MTIRRMQDIWGIRVIVDTLKEVDSIVKSFIDKPWHNLLWVDDYIADTPWSKWPKESWYRSVHLKFSSNYKWDDKSKYNGMKIELQVRTKIQHSRATAVELFTTCIDRWMKSGHGKPEHKRFFLLASKCLENKELWNVDIWLIKELKNLDRELNILKKLQWCKKALDNVKLQDKNFKWNSYIALRLLLRPIPKKSAFSFMRSKEQDYEWFLRMTFF